MYGSPMTTSRAGLRARWVNTRGAVAWMSWRHIPRGNRTRVPSTSAPAARKISTRLGKVADLDPDLLEQRVGVVLDLFEALGRDDLDRGERARQVREAVHRPREALGLSCRATAAHCRVVEILGSHLISSDATRHGETSCADIVRRPVDFGLSPAENSPAMDRS